MQIKFLSLSNELSFRERVHERIDEILYNGHFLNGQNVHSFERAFANSVDMQFCCTCANGLDALKLALFALDLPKGSEVIVPAHTFIATWLAVSQCSLKPIPVDINSDDYKMNLSQVEAAITDNTSAIIPVHLYGEIENISKIQKIVGDRTIHIIEDCAQAHGSKLLNDNDVFNDNRIFCWSFYPGKTLGGLGDGGCITTNNAALASRIKCLSNYGSVEKYVHTMKGFNSRMDEVNASYLFEKLKIFQKEIEARAEIRNYYKQALNFNYLSCKLSFSEDIVNHLFVVETQARDALRTYLDEFGIETLIHYPIPPYQQLAYAGEYFEDDFTIASSVGKEILSLPYGSHLNLNQAEYIVGKVNDFFG